MGGRVLEQRICGIQPSGTYRELFNLGMCPGGTYLLQLLISDKVYVEKITKQ